MSESDLSKQMQQFAGMPASEFILHRASMLLLDRLVESGPEVTACEWQVLETGSFVSPNLGVPAYVGIEYMAQCVAVRAGARARVRGLGPPLGFLLGTRHYEARIRYFAIGVTYRTTCRELIRDDNGMGSYECRILENDEIVASGCLAVLEKKRGNVLSG